MNKVEQSKKVHEPKEVKQQTRAEKIWETIKDREVALFALPAKRVSELSEFMPISEAKCFLKYKITSFLPALEETLGKDFLCGAEGEYIAVDFAEEKK